MHESLSYPINTYHRGHLRPLVVCSRTSEYEAAIRHNRLVLHTAIVVQPLEHGQVDAYLASLGRPLAGLRVVLKTNVLLQELATTPLLLQVLMLTYYGTSARTFSQQEVQLREQIWTDYVQRMVERKGDARRYPLHATRTWLGWLAGEMRQRNQTIFSLEELQPDWLPKRQRTFCQRSTRLIGGLVRGLVIALLGGLFFGQAFGLLGGLVSLLIGGLTFEVRNERFSGLIRGSPLGQEFGLLVGLLSWLLGGLIYGHNGGLIYGLLGGLIGGLIYEHTTVALLSLILWRIKCHICNALSI